MDNIIIAVVGLICTVIAYLIGNKGKSNNAQNSTVDEVVDTAINIVEKFGVDNAVEKLLEKYVGMKEATAKKVVNMVIAEMERTVKDRW